jgi:hypothetical protein
MSYISTEENMELIRLICEKKGNWGFVAAQRYVDGMYLKLIGQNIFPTFGEIKRIIQEETE